MSLTESQLVELYDKQLLHDNIMMYCRGVDRKDYELIKSAYWPDSTDDHGGFIGSGHAFADHSMLLKSKTYSVNHHVSNVLSEIDGDRAKRESMFFMVVPFREPERTVFEGGRYRDLCEKRDGVWKILHRTVIWDWVDVRKVNADWNVFNKPRTTHWGARHPDDPIYKDWFGSPPTEYPADRPGGPTAR